MKTALRYILLTVMFAFLSAGVLTAGYADAWDRLGAGILWLLVPMTAMFLLAVAVNDLLLVPRLLLRSRVAAYCAAVLAMAYTLTLVSLWMEYNVRQAAGMAMRITDYSSPWILADALCNCLLMAMILLGLGVERLYDGWQRETSTLRHMAGRLRAYISAVRDRLNPGHIFRCLQKIVDDSYADSMQIETGVRELSVYLRTQLYELPAPPDTGQATPAAMPAQRIASLITSRRYRAVRHIAFLAVLAVISCGAFFDTPDCPAFDDGHLAGVLSMFATLAVIAYANILWLYPAFMLRGNIRRYAAAVGVMLTMLAAPIIAVQVLTYEHNVYSGGMPAILVVMSTMGSLFTLFLFTGGISAAMLLHNWMETSRRLALLHAETIRQEYAYLRKQINPHFLFNVLNNIGITVYDDPDRARALIGDLVSLLRYQFCDLERDTTTLSQEMAFIRSYLQLEATRRDVFEYETVVEADTDAGLPTLLFIPFVENAVKYSVATDGMPQLSVKVTLGGGRLRFVCANRHDPAATASCHKGGIGQGNTRRRLDLLYGGDYTLRYSKTETMYTVELEIPAI